MQRFLAELRVESKLVSLGPPPIVIGELIIYFKGYVANKHCFSTELASFYPNVDQDVASVVLGYRKWGAALSEYVYGEFALAIYDSLAETLLLTQDCLGIVPLYYRVHTSGVCFSSCIDELSRELGPGDLDEEYIADYLCFGDHSGERTPFKNISRLTAGISICIRRGDLRRQGSWAFKNLSPVRYSDEREYIQEFQRLIDEGVKAALPSTGIALCEVSGGLDSSTVACLASRHFPRNRLHALSHVYPDSPAADESSWSKLVVDSCGLHWHRLNVDAVRPFTELPSERCGQPNHTLVNVALSKAYNRILEKNNIAVVLSGSGGDAVLLGDCPEPYFFADMFRRGRFVSLWKSLCQWSRYSHQPRPVLYWWNRCVVSGTLRHFKRTVIQDEPRRIPWIACDYTLAKNRNGRSRKTWVPNSGGTAETWFLEQVLRSAKVLSVRDDINGMKAEFRYPLMYVPLVKFMCATPWELKFSPAEDRLLQRKAVGDILPRKIALRRTKGNPSQAIYAGLESGRWWKAIRLGTQMKERGYVNGESWTSAVDLARLGRCEDIRHFNAAATLEVWLQTLRCAPSP
jgi:asparagine synthase (glutamine-hydrolysing)